MRKIAFVFPGQGSQVVGMNKELCNEFQTAKNIFEQANDILGYDQMNLCFSGNNEDLKKTENAQPALVTSAYASYKVFQEELGIKPDFLAGHSIGEFSALTCSGAIEFKDVLLIVKRRGQLMQEASALGLGTMAAVNGIGPDVVEQEITSSYGDNKDVGIACYNAPQQTVISGIKEAVEKLCDVFKAKGATCIILNVSAPFHCRIMEPARDKFKTELSQYKFGDLSIPVIANVDAKPYNGRENMVSNLTEQLVQPVRWTETVELLAQNGIDTAFEMGPKNVLQKLMSHIKPDIKTFSFYKKGDVETARNYLNQVDNVAVNGADLMKVLTRSMAICVCTKNSNWDNDEYQKGVIDPYRKIKSLQEELEKENKIPSVEQAKEAILMLNSVFVTKKTPEQERKQRFEQLLTESNTKSLFADFVNSLN